MRVKIPTPLRSYTKGAAEVDADGATVDGLVRDIDARHTGFRFRIIDEQERIRPHIQLFVNDDLVRALDRKVTATDVLMIVCALSGG